MMVSYGLFLFEWMDPESFFLGLRFLEDPSSLKFIVLSGPTSSWVPFSLCMSTV